MPTRASSDPALKPVTVRRRAPALVLVVGVLVLAFLGLVAFGYLAAPGLIRTEALKQIQSAYHRTARLDRVRLDPLSLRLELEGFELPDRDGRPMIGFRRLTVVLNAASLIRRALTLTDVSLEAPLVRVVRRADGRINLADLIPPQSRPKAADAKPFGVEIARLRVAGGEAVLVDAARATMLERRLRNIHLALNNFSSTASGAAFRLSAVSDQGEGLAWEGGVSMTPVASKGHFMLGAWRAAPLAAAAPASLPFTVERGTIDAEGSYEFALGGQHPRLAVTVATAALNEAAIRPPGGSADDEISVRRLRIEGADLDLAERRIRIARLRVEQPTATLIRGKTGAFNLSRYAGAPRNAEPSSAPDFAVSAPDLQLAGGVVTVVDRTSREPLTETAEGVDLVVKNFALPFTEPVAVETRAALDDGSTFRAAGVLTPPRTPTGSMTGAFDVHLAGFELNRLQPYVSEAANLRIAHGEASAAGRVTIGAHGAAGYRGQVEIDDLQTIDPANRSELLSWKSLRLADVVAGAAPLSLRIGKATATGAYARVVLEKNYDLNIRAAIEGPRSKETPAAERVGRGEAALETPPRAPDPPVRPRSGTGAPPVSVGEIAIEDGRMDFTDLTVLPHFSAGIQALSGSITGVSGSADARAKVDLKGGVDRFAPVTISGALAPFAPTRFTDIRMDFRNMELTSFSPYSGKFAGYRIEKGKLSVGLHYLISDNRLDATHHVVVDQLQLGEKVDSADAVKLPVRLIVALLKDKNGVIDLPIDISGSLDDPKFKIWPVIWKVVGNLFEKIAAAPFTLLSKLAGGSGGEEISKIQFAPGDAAVPEVEKPKLAALAASLAERPNLSLEIPVTEAPALDRAALSKTRYDQAVAAASRAASNGGKGPSAPAGDDPTARRRALEALFVQRTGKRPPPPPKTAGRGQDADRAACAWLDATLAPLFAADEASVHQLGQARAEAVEGILLAAGKITPERLFVIASKPIEGERIAMELALR